MSALQDNNEIAARNLAWTLSLGGFIPFGVLSIFLFFVGPKAPLFGPFVDIFIIWSVLILSFLGGIRWGFAVASPPFDTKSLCLSVVPSILGWFAVLLPETYTLLVLLVLFSAHGAWDSFFVNAGNAPPWFGSIRITLTFLVAFAHVLVIIALSGGLFS